MFIVEEWGDLGMFLWFFRFLSNGNWRRKFVCGLVGLGFLLFFLFKEGGEGDSSSFDFEGEEGRKIYVCLLFWGLLLIFFFVDL